MFHEFVKEVEYSFNPFKYTKLIENSSYKATKFLIKILIIAFILSMILYIPSLADVPDFIDRQLKKVDEVHVSGNFTLSDPIVLPEENPLLIVDTNHAYSSVGNALFLFTDTSISFNQFGEVIQVEYSELKEFYKVTDKLSKMIFFIVLLTIPTFALMVYLTFLIKYFLIAFVSSALFYLLLDLTFLQVSFRRIFTISLYSTIILVLLEQILIPIKEDLLYASFGFLWIKFYVVSTLIYLIFFLFNAIIVGKYIKSLKEENEF